MTAIPKTDSAVEIKDFLMKISLNDHTWREKSNCMGVDTNLFYPERGVSTKEAKEVCQGCQVSGECLKYAILNGEKFGIWGGKSERERRGIRREMPFRRSRKLAEEYRDDESMEEIGKQIRRA